MRRLLLPLLVLPVLVAAGCGSEDASGDSAPAADCAEPCIVMQDTEFVPRDLTVQAGQTVTWVNRDPVVHDVANVEEGAEPRSPLFGQSGTFTYTADEPGRIEYVCTIHPGMEGTITVR